MTLVALIRKRESLQLATATLATGQPEVQPSVASVAIVAGEKRPVATPESLEALDQRGDEVISGIVDVVVEPASPTAKPIYWEAMDGTWHGPVRPEYLGRTGRSHNEQFWIIVSYSGAFRWIWADLLRSHQAFLARKRIGI